MRILQLLAILKISNVYHKTFQIVDYIITMYILFLTKMSVKIFINFADII